MLSLGPDILLQGYDNIIPSCCIEPRLLARALSRHMGLISPCSITIPYIYIPLQVTLTRRGGRFLGGASWRPVKMRPKSISPSPLCGRLADSEIDPRKTHALRARGLPWAHLGTPWAQHVIPYEPPVGPKALKMIHACFPWAPTSSSRDMIISFPHAA